MKKRLITVLTTGRGMQYAIRMETLGDGRIQYTPVVKQEGWLSSWIPIVKVNDSYEAIHLETGKQFTEAEAMGYIQAYRDQLAARDANKVIDTKYALIV